MAFEENRPAGLVSDTSGVEPAPGASTAQASMRHDEAGKSAPTPAKTARRVALFAAAVVAWLALDQLSKAHFEGDVTGQVISGPYLGVFQFRLVHNTGMAWGMLGDSTLLLGVFSLVVCAVVLVLFCMSARHASTGLTLGLALVFAGGVGNAIDRLTIGYVIDFIEPVFIDFPVFNVADIGVTCGVVIVLIALFVHGGREGS